MARSKLLYPDSYILLIARYLSEKNQRCFTYRGFRVWFYKQPYYKNVEWHTVERMIRKLAEEGFLNRKFIKRNYVVFCKNERFEEVFEDISRSLKSY